MAAYAPAPLPSLSLVFFAPDNSVGAPAPLPSLSLVLQTGSHAPLFGQEASFAVAFLPYAVLKCGRKVVSAAGSFALSGQAATLTKASPGFGAGAPSPLPHLSMLLERPATDPLMGAQAGLFALSGVAANLKSGNGLTAVAGTFTFSGAPALRDLQVTADVGAFTVTRNAAGLSRLQSSFQAAAGAFTFSGNPAGLAYQFVPNTYLLTASFGTFALSGQAANFARSARAIVAGTGTFAVTGLPAGLVYEQPPQGRTMAGSFGAFVMSGVDAAFAQSAKALTANAGAFNVNGLTAGLVKTGGSAFRVLTADYGSFVLAGQDAALPSTINRRLVCDTGSYTVTRNSANLVAVRWGRIDGSSSTWTEVTPNSTTWTS